MDEGEYDLLLVLMLVFLMNALFWLRGMNDTPNRVSNDNVESRLIHVIRTSPLLRLPLALSTVKVIWEWPVLLIYLLNALNVPANIMTLLLITTAVGNVASVALWGRLADRVGCRRVFVISYIAAFGVFPILLFLPDFAQLDPDSPTWFAGVAVMALFGLAKGVISAGQNVTMTLFYTGYLSEGQGFFALNILTATTRLFLAGLTAVGGLALVHAETLN